MTTLAAKFRRGDPHPNGNGLLFWATKSKRRIDGSVLIWNLWVNTDEMRRRKAMANMRSNEWRRRNPEKVAAQKRSRFIGEKRALNLAAAKVYNKRQYWKFRESKLAANKAWRESNKEIIREKRRVYRRARLMSDPVFKIKRLVGRRLRLFLDGRSFIKEQTTGSIIGCTWQQLRDHLESLFAPGMSWGNKHLWHIDHIIPLKTAQSKEDVYRLFHYTNLQPLWGPDNLAKGAKMPHQLSA